MNRDKSITFRVNDAEAEQIRTLAMRRGKTVAEYLRWLVDRDEATITILVEAGD